MCSLKRAVELFYPSFLLPNENPAKGIFKRDPFCVVSVRMKNPKTREGKVKYGRGWQKFERKTMQFKDPCNFIDASANTGTLLKILSADLVDIY